MADNNRWNNASASLPDPDDDDYDYNYNENTGESKEDDPTVFVKPSPNSTSMNGKTDMDTMISQEYIIGTLVVRVVAARDLEPIPRSGGGGLGSLVFGSKGGGGGGGGGSGGMAHKGGNGGGNGTANPYASVKFGNSTQRTSEVYDTLDPVWPRQEAMFMDVSLPVGKIAHTDSSSSGTRTSVATTGANQQQNKNNKNSSSSKTVEKNAVATATSTPSMALEQEQQQQQQPPPTILTIALFHAAEIGRAQKFAKGLVQKSGDSNDRFLGMASIDLQRLLTGRDHTFDGWLQLSGTESSRGYVRLVCEYEPSDSPPRTGDYCRFTRYCDPKDLYPLQVGRQYRIAQVQGDLVLISYETSEGWVCSFQAHRFMLICDERHCSTVEAAQDEFASVAERLAHSPLVHTISHTVERVAVDGILTVGEDIARGGVGLFHRWFTGGVETMVADVANVINWDGRHNPDVAEDLDLPNFQASSQEGDDEDGPRRNRIDEQRMLDSKPPAIRKLALSSTNDDEEPEALPNMPACPITGFPMVDPVVAADGHTYERSAIARWLTTSNKSPMTGSILPHKELVTNYGLLSSIREAAAAARAVTPAAAAAASLVKTPSDYSLLSRMADIPRKIEVDESASVTPSGLFSLDGLETVTMGGGTTTPIHGGDDEDDDDDDDEDDDDDDDEDDDESNDPETDPPHPEESSTSVPRGGQ